METLMKLRILDKSNESIISIARGSEPTVRCSPISSAGQGLCKNKDFNKPRRARSSRRSKFPRKFSLFLRVLRALRGKKNAFTQSLINDIQNCVDIVKISKGKKNFLSSNLHPTSR